MRLVNTPRESLCSHLEINCKSNEKCVLLDEFLPLVGCKHKTFRPRTISPNIPTTQHPTTRPPTLPPATLPPTLPPIIHPPTIPTKYKPPGKTATESDKRTQNESPSGGQHTDQYVPPEVEEIYEDDKKWLATLLPVMFIGGAVVVIACLVTCIIRYIKQRRTTQQNDSDTEAQLADKKKVKKRRKHKDKDTKQSNDIRRKKRKKRKMEKFDEVN
ncbi:hypothetical protein AC249_AIPGENE13079 [Exaiptasia diaphana]|nr:hypothetical protein AC249_AIPGENE13079 [Exaiptasia diaphana]